MSPESEKEMFEEYRKTLEKLAFLCAMFGGHVDEPRDELERKLLIALGKPAPPARTFKDPYGGL